MDPSARAEVPTFSALAKPTSATPVLFAATTPRAPTLTPSTTGHFSLTASEAPPMVVGAKALMCGDAVVDGGTHVD
jgi:hypothetical protein